MTLCRRSGARLKGPVSEDSHDLVGHTVSSQQLAIKTGLVAVSCEGQASARVIYEIEIRPSTRLSYGLMAELRHSRLCQGLDAGNTGFCTSAKPLANDGKHSESERRGSATVWDEEHTGCITFERP